MQEDYFNMLHLLTAYAKESAQDKRCGCTVVPSNARPNDKGMNLGAMHAGESGHRSWLEERRGGD